ncbi:MAG: hypothetical protein ACJAZO_004407 [Myxococcota bacterium]|jgi:hypothetical protein
MRHLSLIALVLAACGTATDPAVSTETPVVSEDAHGAVHEEADAAHATADAEWASFGAPMASDNTVALSDLLDNPDTYTGQTVRVQGTVADVCQMAGCWMVMADGERTMRVTMKDHGFAIDKDAATSMGEVEGVVIARPADPERTAHFASEAANPDAMPENTGADMLYEISATGVRIKNG